ncbi:hypothetical protein F5Y10DRAFT_250984 [Nemania abortiva]|nr:hypothetical protein F5Y10DRAFT_250984 [Nemania abortiva]
MMPSARIAQSPPPDRRRVTRSSSSRQITSEGLPGQKTLFERGTLPERRTLSNTPPGMSPGVKKIVEEIWEEIQDVHDSRCRTLAKIYNVTVEELQFCRNRSQEWRGKVDDLLCEVRRRGDNEFADLIVTTLLTKTETRDFSEITLFDLYDVEMIDMIKTTAPDHAVDPSIVEKPSITVTTELSEKTSNITVRDHGVDPSVSEKPSITVTTELGEEAIDLTVSDDAVDPSVIEEPCITVATEPSIEIIETTAPDHIVDPSEVEKPGITVATESSMETNEITPPNHTVGPSEVDRTDTTAMAESVDPSALGAHRGSVKRKRPTEVCWLHQLRPDCESAKRCRQCP